MSNVGRHKEHVSESHASRQCSKAVKASRSMYICNGWAARKSNAYASFQAGATPLCRGCRDRWLFPQTNNTSFQAQLVPALARCRRQMLVSLWALPLSQGRRDLRSTVRSGSGLGSIQAVPRLPTAVTPNLSIEGTASGLRPPAAPHVKR